MDDLSFFDTTDDLYRGGIWDKSVRPKPNEEPQVPVENVPEKEIAPGFGKSPTLPVGYSNDLEVSNRGPLRHRNTISGGEVFKDGKLVEKPSPLSSIAGDLSTLDTVTTVNDDPEEDEFIKEHIGELKGFGFVPESPTKDSNQTKATIVGTVKKWGGWYFKDKASRNSISGDPVVNTSSSLDKEGAKHLTAPKAHDFPPELIDALTNSPEISKPEPYSAIPEMKLPSSLSRKPELQHQEPQLQKASKVNDHTPLNTAELESKLSSSSEHGYNRTGIAPAVSPVHNPPKTFPKRKPVGGKSAKKLPVPTSNGDKEEADISLKPVSSRDNPSLYILRAAPPAQTSVVTTSVSKHEDSDSAHAIPIPQSLSPIKGQSSSSSASSSFSSKSISGRPKSVDQLINHSVSPPRSAAKGNEQTDAEAASKVRGVQRSATTVKRKMVGTGPSIPSGTSSLFNSAVSNGSSGAVSSAGSIPPTYGTVASGQPSSSPFITKNDHSSDEDNKERADLEFFLNPNDDISLLSEKIQTNAEVRTDETLEKPEKPENPSRERRSSQHIQAVKAAQAAFNQTTDYDQAALQNA